MRAYDFNFKAEVHCQDGPCGKLAGLVVDPDTLQVTALILENGFFVKQDWILPLHLLEDVTEERLYLAVNTTAVEDYPGYHVTEYDEPATALELQSANVVTAYGTYSPLETAIPMIRRKVREGIAPGQQVIEAGMPVNGPHNTLGQVDRVVVDRGTKKIIQLVVTRGLIFKDQVTIPNSVIEYIDEERIFLSDMHK